MATILVLLSCVELEDRLASTPESTFFRSLFIPLVQPRTSWEVGVVDQQLTGKSNLKHHGWSGCTWFFLHGLPWSVSGLVTRERIACCLHDRLAGRSAFVRGDHSVLPSAVLCNGGMGFVHTT